MPQRQSPALRDDNIVDHFFSRVAVVAVSSILENGFALEVRVCHNTVMRSKLNAKLE